MLESSGLGGGRSTLMEKAVRNRAGGGEGRASRPGHSGAPGALRAGAGKCTVHPAGSWPDRRGRRLKLQTSQRMVSLFCILNPSLEKGKGF